MDDPSEPLYNKLAESIIPAAYAGLLFTILAAHAEPVWTRGLQAAVDPLILLPAILFCGLGIYLLYRIIIGEWILFPLRHAIHSGMDFAWRKWLSRQKPAQFHSITRLLASEGVSFGYRRRVYTELRKAHHVIGKELADRLDLLHATYHFFYITAVEFLGAAWYLQQNQREWKNLAIAGSVFIVLAYVADMRQDTWECRLIGRDRDALRQFVGSLGFEPVHLDRED